MDIREAIRTANDLKLTPCEVPEWGMTLHLRQLNVGERLELFRVLGDDTNKDKLLYVVAILFTACDPDGKRLFTLEDYDLLNAKNGEVILRLGREAAKLNKLVGEPIEDAKKN